MTSFVDSSVLLDIFTEDPRWFAWSSGALADAADRGNLAINAVVYAEISARFSTIEELEALLPADVFEFQPVPREAAFLAARAFLDYRRRGGFRDRPLPDFFIGAHAAVEDVVLVTRDPARIRAYFPTVRLICP
ncbi:MAG: type II toxin-antitoxin system VapC family toxin [Planctomycetes bacterium]|jgi:hypothetical protein|nr:type II toxin-antitoxin system VapC family toxin [Planctomycetota bacterium]